jgi:TonB family protein
LSSSIRIKVFIVAILAASLAGGAAASSLIQEGSKPQAAPPRLLSDLKNKRPATRRNAAEQLGAMRARDSVRPLIAALADADVGVREAAAFALGQLADPLSALPLTRSLSDKNTEVRASAAFALGMIGERKSIASLSDALHDDEAAVRAAAAVGLGLMQDPEAVDELIALLGDDSFDVRYDAVWALGYIGEPDALGPLRAALANLDSLQVSDESREAFRQNAQTALDSLRTAEHEQLSRARARRVTEPPDTSSDPKAYSTVVTPAEVQQASQAAPTERARRARLQGTVTLKVLVGADGRAVRAYVVRRLGYGLDGRAVEAILQYHFTPAKQAGLPQTSWMNLDVKF